MTLLFADGFDHYDSAALMARKWDGSGTGVTQATGRNGRAWSVPNAATYKNVANKQTLINGFAYYVTGTIAGSNAIMSYKDAGTIQVDLVINTNGSISVRRNGVTVLGTTSAGLVHITTWHYIEWKVKIDNTVGTVHVHLDGTEVLALTGQDTQQTANAYATTVNFEYPGYGNYYDDFYLCDDAGSLNNDFLGDVKIETLYPDGAGNSTQWTPSAGNNYDCVNETIQNDDTDYVEESTVNDIDLYTYGALATSSGTVKATQANLIARKTDAGARQIREKTRTGGTNYSGATQTLSGGYIDYREIREVDPNTTVAWTIAGVNGAEYGVEVVA